VFKIVAYKVNMIHFRMHLLRVSFFPWPYKKFVNKSLADIIKDKLQNTHASGRELWTSLHSWNLQFLRKLGSNTSQFVTSFNVKLETSW
jgi:hypothetical protein